MLSESELSAWHDREVRRLEKFKDSVTLDCSQVECHHTISILRQILQIPAMPKGQYELIGK